MPRYITAALSASGPTVFLRLQQYPPPGSDALQVSSAKIISS